MRGAGELPAHRVEIWSEDFMGRAATHAAGQLTIQEKSTKVQVRIDGPYLQHL
jgi:hypothetical protein